MGNVNAGFLGRAQQIIENRPSGNFGNDLWKLQMDKGETYFVAYTSKYTIDLLVHLFKGSPATLCNMMYFDLTNPEEKAQAHCEDCLKPGFQGKGFNIPSNIKAGLGYVFSLVGQKGTTTKGKEFEHNPHKIIEVSGGKGQANFENLNSAIAEGYLQYTEENPIIWRLQRLPEGGMSTPAPLADVEIRKLRKQMSLDVPPETLVKFDAMSQGEVFGKILVSYGNCNKKYLEGIGVIFPAKPDMEGEDEETSTDELDK